MKVNLKFIEDMITGVELADHKHPAVQIMLKETATLLRTICKDLEVGGESIIELDKSRVDAIKEREDAYRTIRKNR